MSRVLLPLAIVAHLDQPRESLPSIGKESPPIRLPFAHREISPAATTSRCRTPVDQQASSLRAPEPQNAAEASRQPGDPSTATEGCQALSARLHRTKQGG